MRVQGGCRRGSALSLSLRVCVCVSVEPALTSCFESPALIDVEVVKVNRRLREPIATHLVTRCFRLSTERMCALV